MQAASLIPLLFLVLSALIGCEDNGSANYQPLFTDTPPVQQEITYTFGIHPLHNPVRLHETFYPVMEYLSANIPGARFEMEASRSYAAYEEKLYARQFHFALPNPYETVMAMKQGYRVFGKMANDDDFRGVFLVRKDSSIREVHDLKGRKVGFPAPTALAATLMPQYFLQSHGLNVMQDIDIVYVGSQESSVMNVMLGNVAAAAIWLPPWRAIAGEHPEFERELKIIWRTDSLPSNGLLVRDDVPADILSRVAELLFGMHTHDEGRKRLSRMEQTHFVPASNETYRPVQEFLVRFNQEVRPIEH